MVNTESISRNRGELKIKLFDLHCDTAYECYMKNQEFKDNTLAVSAVKGAVFDDWHQTFAVWIKDEADNPFLLYKRIVTDFKRKLNNNLKNITPIFALEGGAAIENSDCLYEMHSDKVKIITLTWNGENRIAGGCKTDKGLTVFGREIIDDMNRLKIACDMSHLNEKSFYSAIERTQYPIATHSNCKKIHNNERNLTDRQVKMICEKDGIIGLCPYPEFLGGDVAEKLYENICHICFLGYEDNIGIGTDFDGAKQAEFLSDISKIPLLYEKLKEKGLNEGLLNKIFYKNAYNFIAKLS